MAQPLPTLWNLKTGITVQPLKTDTDARPWLVTRRLGAVLCGVGLLLVSRGDGARVLQLPRPRGEEAAPVLGRRLASGETAPRGAPEKGIKLEKGL